MWKFIRKTGFKNVCLIRYTTHNNEETEFWTAARRQYGVILIVNMATFLFGASQPTASISLPRLPINDSYLSNDTAWPRDFSVTSDEGEWISKCYCLILRDWYPFGMDDTFNLQPESGYCLTLCLALCPTLWQRSWGGRSHWWLTALHFLLVTYSMVLVKMWQVFVWQGLSWGIL